MRNEKMRTLFLRFVLFFFLFSFVNCVSNNHLSPIEIPADFTGVVGGQTNSPEEYALLDAMGADWLLATFYWSRIEPEDDKWFFDNYDKYVDVSKAAGKKILGVLGYSNSWIHDDGKWPQYIPPDKMDFFLDFVRQTASRYRGKVDAWCIWNEPNFTFWKGPKKEFFELTRQTADALRETDPDIIILGGAFNRGIFGLPRSYIKGLFESGAMEKADGVAFHPYELNPARTQKLYKKFEKICARYGFGDSVWATETGYPTGGWYPTAVREKRFPEYIVKTIVNLAVEGVNKVIWYELFDPVVRVKGNSEHHFGLVRSTGDYTSKGAEAFSLCSRYISGTTCYPLSHDSLPQSLKAYYFESQTKTLVLWKDGIPIRLQSGVSGLMHDPVTGESVAINPDTVITVRAMPVFITWEEETGAQLQRVR